MKGAKEDVMRNVKKMVIETNDLASFSGVLGNPIVSILIGLSELGMEFAEALEASVEIIANNSEENFGVVCKKSLQICASRRGDIVITEGEKRDVRIEFAHDHEKALLLAERAIVSKNDSIYSIPKK